tara:strand:- start:406 stop:570 length:165 start_codon:yes stop_codon:yes gene_type:complete
MIIRKKLLIIVSALILLGLATFSLIEKNIDNEVLDESSGCSSCSGPKAFKSKNK